MKKLKMAARLILASDSPRRKTLMTRIVPRGSFITVKSRVRERTRPGETPRKFAVRMAEAKASDVAVRIRIAKGRTAIIVAADTVIDLAGKTIGQPHNQKQARAILGRLSGRRHDVITGLAFIRLPDEKRIRLSVTSSVWMKKLKVKTIDDYVQSGEPMDKAGAYGIQGMGKRLIRKYRGSFTNIVGFPLREVGQILRVLSP